MSDTSKTFRRVEVRDSTGVVETFVPEPVFRAVSEDRAAIEERLTKMQGERDRLRQELEAARRDRDRYAASLRPALGADLPRMTAEELEDLRANGVSQEAFFLEIDRLFPAEPTGA